MLPWWGWVLLWVLLLVGSGLLIAQRARRVWGSTKALGSEVERASAMVAALEAAADRLRDLEPPPTAVTQPPHRVWRQYREQRAASVAVRRARRAERMPPWARVD